MANVANAKVVRFKDANGEWESADSLLRRFKKAVLKADVIKNVRKHEYFISKPMRRKLKSEEHQKMLRRKKNKNR